MTVDYKSFIGKSFGKYTVLDVDHSEKRDGRFRVFMKCFDKKGNIRIIRYDYLARDRIYTIYKHMIDRCFNPKNPYFNLYGGRNITVCEEWKNDYKSFQKWSLENGYKENLSIDRINNDGNYCPENCRWTTMLVQQINRGNNRRIFYNGKNLCLSEWCRLLGFKHNAFLGRLKKNNWTYEETLRSYIHE